MSPEIFVLPSEIVEIDFQREQEENNLAVRGAVVEGPWLVEYCFLDYKAMRDRAVPRALPSHNIQHGPFLMLVPSNMLQTPVDVLPFRFDQVGEINNVELSQAKESALDSYLAPSARLNHMVENHDNDLLGSLS